MSRSIYERRQLRPYTVKWTVRSVAALTFFCMILLAIVGGTVWIIATSDNPLGYSVLAVLAIAVMIALLQRPPSEESWRTGVMVWMFTRNVD